MALRVSCLTRKVRERGLGGNGMKVPQYFHTPPLRLSRPGESHMHRARHSIRMGKGTTDGIEGWGLNSDAAEEQECESTTDGIEDWGSNSDTAAERGACMLCD